VFLRRPAEISTNSTDEHLDHIAAVLDDMFRIPGTQIRFGLDFLIGWIPGVGDAVAGAASLIIIVAAWQRGAAIVTLARMVTNVVLEAVLGAIPILGDVFHVVWKANRRNYRLFMREKGREPGENHAWRDALFLALLLVTVLCLAAIPIGLILWLVRSRKMF
jgi:Domain of unknown function (DUF4112)